MKLSFLVDAGFSVGIQRLASVLQYELGEGLQITAQQGERIGFDLENGKAVIHYRQKHHFWRELALLVQAAKEQDCCHVTEDGAFQTVGVMIDTSRCAVPTLDTLYRMTDYLATMGYGMAMLYTEDTVEMKEYPYFGYMRGRYTREQLTAFDDYANDYGIEIIPCIECYGHMEKYLLWPEAAPIKDTESILMAREEKTFAFLDDWIRTVSSCFRSKRIHLGMDEAWNMGRGAFMDKHGYVPPMQIFSEYMERLIAITDRYGLRPMIWSDMYFRNNHPDRNYYAAETEVSEEDKQRIPKNVELVFWHYGEAPHCDDYMLAKHKALDRHVLFAGGVWNWAGHFPENYYTLEATSFSLNACRKNGVDEVIMTMWFNDNAECDLFAGLSGLSLAASLMYDPNADYAKMKADFAATVNGDLDGFFTMSNYHNKLDGDEVYERFHDRFLGKPLFWQDVLEGLYETHMQGRGMSEHYAKSAAKMAKYQGGTWDYLYRFAEEIFGYMAVKCAVAERLTDAYRNDDRETLSLIANKQLPEMQERIGRIHKMHKKMWFATNNPLGWSNMDIRYAGAAARCDTAIERIEAYLNGELSRIEELEQERLHKPLRAFDHYSTMSTVNLKT